jgi:hypothetical protein
MDRLHYTNKTLVGNWYEDRLDHSRAPLPELERTGQYRPTPIKMSRPIPNFYETTSSSAHTSFDTPILPTPLHFLTVKNLSTADRLTKEIEEKEEGEEVKKVKTQNRAHDRGFGSLLPRHDDEFGFRSNTTTTHSVYGGRDQDQTTERIHFHNSRLIQTNTLDGDGKGKILNSTDKIQRGVGSTDVLRATGERLCLDAGHDPKTHTFIQKAYLYDRSHLQYYLRDPSATQVEWKNVDGCSLKGLGEQHARNVPKPKRNDTIRQNTGIWKEW